MKNRTSKLLVVALFALPSTAAAQMGDHRNDFVVGVNGGCVLSNVDFTPGIRQSMHGGVTGGLSVCYMCEKYFNTICSICGEMNYTSIGRREKILTDTDRPVINSSGDVEAYSRATNYIQISALAHLAWGREQNGFNFFFQAGLQLGFYSGESISKNYGTPNLANDSIGRSGAVTAQESMPVEKKLGYDITASLSLEHGNRHAGHFLLEARYYYGLGSTYGSSKKDCFGESSYGSIVVKAAHLFDIIKAKQ